MTYKEILARDKEKAHDFRVWIESQAYTDAQEKVWEQTRLGVVRFSAKTTDSGEVLGVSIYNKIKEEVLADYFDYLSSTDDDIFSVLYNYVKGFQISPFRMEFLIEDNIATYATNSEIAEVYKNALEATREAMQADISLAIGIIKDTFSWWFNRAEYEIYLHNSEDYIGR